MRETPAGLEVFVVTGGLSNEWQLTYVGPAGEAALVPFSALAVLPGVLFLTDPELAPLGQVLPWLLLGDPVLRPVSRDGLAGRPAGPAAGAAYDAAGPPVAAAVSRAAASARSVAARRATPASIRSGVGAENDSRSMFCPSPFT